MIPLPDKEGAWGCRGLWEGSYFWRLFAMTVQRLDSEEERKLLRKGESTSFEAQSLTLLGFLPQEHMGKKCPRKPKPHHQRC